MAVPDRGSVEHHDVGVQPFRDATPVVQTHALGRRVAVHAHGADGIRLAGPIAVGVVGVAAWRLDGTGQKVLANADIRFPMASTFKVAVAGALLAAVDEGRLSLDDMIAGARVEVAPYKKNPHDFVLWKPSKENEPAWPSPWGEGRPGWHIECSAMIEANLGLPIDIHGGGIDLRFPHHENEIAQGVCAHGHGEPQAYARYWMHNGFLTIDAEKMSKSVGNVLLLHDLVREIPGEVVRWALLSAHYRQPLDWTRSLLDQSRKNLDRLYGALKRASGVAATTTDAPAAFVEAVSDDLNTPAAMAVLFTLSSEIERAMTTGDEAAVGRAKGELIASGALLGVLQADPDAWFEGGADAGLKAEVEALIAERVTARAEKNWTEADRIRDRLNALNVIVMDSPSGATWRLKE